MDLNDKAEVKDSLNGVKYQNVLLNKFSEEDFESEFLLPPKKGGLSKKSGKPGRKVQWNDKNGNKLAEVLEFQPSDESESDDELSVSCFCTVM